MLRRRCFCTGDEFACARFCPRRVKRDCVETCIDPNSRFAVAFAANSAASRNTAIALDALIDLLPIQPQYLLSDNGSEFMGDFPQRLDERGIIHWWPTGGSTSDHPK